MPLYAHEMKKGFFIKWLLDDGAYVTIGELMFELEYDGNIYRLESFDYGVINFIEKKPKMYEVGHILGKFIMTHEDVMKSRQHSLDSELKYWKKRGNAY